jgi:putative ABC transport system permease protein
MIKSHLRIAWRNLIKNKTTSLINIGGLAVGISVAMLIGLWIWDELSFDKYHDNYDRIAQVMENDTYNGTTQTGHSIPLPLEGELRRSYGDYFSHIAMSSPTKDHILSEGENKISYSGIFIGAAGPEMFSLKMTSGNRDALKDRSAVLISQSVARALFANTDPIGKLIKIDDTANFRVSGVYEDLPSNTTLNRVTFMAPWDFYLTSAQWIREATNEWGNTSFQMFVQVVGKADMAQVSEKIRNAKLNRVGPDEAKTDPQIFLQPMSRWHLYSEFNNGVNTGGAIQYVWLFAVIGLFVLLLACINFMNLSTASSEKRAKEVGIRKAAGSLRVQLISQFFCESIFITVLAFVLSILIAWLSLPFFNEVANKKMTMLWGNPFFWVISLGFAIFTGIISGSYPALYLSSFNPVKVLKGTFKAGRAAAIPRKVLVVLQFAVSIILIISTVIVFRQIQFAKSRPIGYSRNGLVNINMVTAEIRSHFTSIRGDLLRSGMVLEAAQSSSPVTAVMNTRHDISWKEKDPSMAADFAAIRVTSEYGKTVGLQFIEGRDFSAQMLTDSSSLILNEAAVKYMGLKKPIGETVNMMGRNFNIIGVVKDMVMASPYEPVKQTIYFIVPSGFDDMIVKINPKVSAHEAIGKIESICKRYSESAPFSYKFADDEYDRKFNNESRIGKLSSVFAALAVFISCLGMFGMATFMAEQRTKEIGVRKVLGATVFNLWQLLSKDFVLLVIISLLIASPVSYLFMHNWLQHYHYRTEITWWIFLVAGGGALIITLLTVSFQSIKAAIANPVKSLRSE